MIVCVRSPSLRSPCRWHSRLGAPWGRIRNTHRTHRIPNGVDKLRYHQNSKAAESEEDAFLHSSMVQSIAHALHLDVNTASHIFLVINFAVIFFAIVIPLARVMPRMFRKRSETISHDLKTARDATADANARLSAIEAKLAGLGEEMKRFRDQIERESLEDEKRIKAAIVEESARIVTSAEQEITMAAAQARRGLRNFAAELAIDHAGKQLKLTPETDAH